MAIPVIDLSPIFTEGAFSEPLGSEMFELVGRVDEACQQWGFYNVVNHGIKPELFEKVEAHMKVLFASDKKVKEVNCFLQLFLPS